MKCKRCGEVNPAEIHTCSPQEPVAWIIEAGGGLERYLVFGKPEYYKGTPLYTAPPQREWQGLTDEDIWELVQKTPDFSETVAAIEAKLKEKNS